MLGRGRVRDGRAGDKEKSVLLSLSEELLNRISNMDEQMVLPLAETLGTSANEKHVQL